MDGLWWHMIMKRFSTTAAGGGGGASTTISTLTHNNRNNNHHNNKANTASSLSSTTTTSSSSTTTPATFWILILLSVWILNMNMTNVFRVVHETSGSSTDDAAPPAIVTSSSSSSLLLAALSDNASTSRTLRSTSSSTTNTETYSKDEEEEEVRAAAKFVTTMERSNTVSSSSSTLSSISSKQAGAAASSSSTTTTHLSPPTKQKTKQRQRSSSSLYRKIPKRPTALPREDLVMPGDYIYYQNINASWDSSPIVIESHKLIFFTIPKVGCTVWKQLFRRMMGYSDWMSQEYDTYQPHNPSVNGLKYLYNYTTRQASIMMTSPQWKRVIMVRDPKQRFLSAFLDKSVGNYHLHIIDRCCPDSSCVENAQTVAGFLQLITHCYDDHWRPQNDRVDDKYWPYIDYVAHVENAAIDARTILTSIGAWQDYGATGWGYDGSLSIFASTDANSVGMNHSTYSQWKVWQWYTPETEQLVENFYRQDYENPLFQFVAGDCLTCITEETNSTTTDSTTTTTTAADTVAAVMAKQ